MPGIVYICYAEKDPLAVSLGNGSHYDCVGVFDKFSKAKEALENHASEQGWPLFHPAWSRPQKYRATLNNGDIVKTTIFMTHDKPECFGWIESHQVK